MTIPKGQSWPQVKRTCTSGSKLPSCVADIYLFQTHGAHHGQPWFPLMPVLWDTTIWVCPRTTWQPKPWPTGWCDHHGLLHKFNNSRVFCQKGPTRHAYAWQIGPFCRIPSNYGISGKANSWTADCLSCWSEQVVIEGCIRTVPARSGRSPPRICAGVGALPSVHNT